MTRPSRQADCHPEKKHIALGMCSPCYVKSRRDKRSDEQRAKDNFELRAKRFGFTPEGLSEFLDINGDQCAVCKSTEKLHIDHCHTTGKVRGLLCSSCNTALGLLNDDPSRMDMLARYIRERA